MSDFPPARLQAVKDLPVGPGWLYEPKFDGYRGLLVSSAKGNGSVWSRNDKDLGRWFPELVELARGLPPATVLDGEIVMPTGGGVSFIALQRRLAQLGRESPVAFIAFDVLRSGEDLRRLTLSQRRRRLVRIVEAQGDSALQLMTQTADLDVAEAWLDTNLDITGIEGVVCKLDEPYPGPNVRRWRKVRRVWTTELIVRGFIPEGESLRLVLAAADDHRRLVGSSYPIRMADAGPLRQMLDDAVPAERRIWAPFDDGRHDWYELQTDAPPIVEVAVTTLDSGMLRQPARFVRWRPAGPA